MKKFNVRDLPARMRKISVKEIGAEVSRCFRGTKEAFPYAIRYWLMVHESRCHYEDKIKASEDYDAFNRFSEKKGGDRVACGMCIFLEEEMKRHARESQLLGHEAQLLEVVLSRMNERGFYQWRTWVEDNAHLWLVPPKGKKQ